MHKSCLDCQHRRVCSYRKNAKIDFGIRKLYMENYNTDEFLEDSLLLDLKLWSIMAKYCKYFKKDK